MVPLRVLILPPRNQGEVSGEIFHFQLVNKNQLINKKIKKTTKKCNT